MIFYKIGKLEKKREIVQTNFVKYFIRIGVLGIELEKLVLFVQKICAILKII